MCAQIRMTALLVLLHAGPVAWCTPLNLANFSNPNVNTHVVVEDDATQSYELYAPTSIPAAGPYTIWYGFDPTGNAKFMLSLLSAAALDQGWIVAVSNNSKNGISDAEVFAAQDAVLRDTEARIDLLPSHRFTSGFSHAAINAFQFARRYPDKIVGAMTMGGDDGEDFYPLNPEFACYILIGRSDPAFWQMGPTLLRLLGHGYPAYGMPYVGGHVTPSSTLVRGAFAWLAENAGTGAYPPYQECDPAAAFSNSPEIVLRAMNTSISTGNTYSCYQYIGHLPGKATALTWWGGTAHYNSTTQEYTNCGRATESFRIAFMLDSAGTPGNAVAAQTVTPTREYIGEVFNNVDIYRYRYEFPEPVDFGSAEWLRIACVPQSDGCGWLWSRDWQDQPPAMQLYLPNASNPAAFNLLDTRLAVCVETDAPTSEGQATDGAQEGASEGAGGSEGAADGLGEGLQDGAPEGAPEGTPEGVAEGIAEGEGGGYLEGTPEAESPHYSTVDVNRDWHFSLSELLRVIQLFSLRGYHCAAEGETSEDTFMPGDDPLVHTCPPCSADFEPQDWRIDLQELLREIQFYNGDGYRSCDGEADGFCLNQP